MKKSLLDWLQKLGENLTELKLDYYEPGPGYPASFISLKRWDLLMENPRPFLNV